MRQHGLATVSFEFAAKPRPESDSTRQRNESAAMREHERKANGVEEDAAKTGIDNALHQNVHGFTGTAESGFQHCEPYLHAENQEGRDEGPRRVNRIYHIRSFHFRSGALGV